MNIDEIIKVKEILNRNKEEMTQAILNDITMAIFELDRRLIAMEKHIGILT